MNPSDTSDFVLLGPSHSFASHMKCFTSRAFRLQTLILKINRLYAVPVLDLSSSAGLRAAQHYSEMKSRCFLSRVSEEIVEDLPAAPNPYSAPLGWWAHWGAPSLLQAKPSCGSRVRSWWPCPGWSTLHAWYFSHHRISHRGWDTNVCWALNWTLLHYRNSDGAFSKHWGWWIEEHFCIIIFHLPPLSFSTLSLHFRGQHFHLVQTPARWPSVNPLMHDGPTANSLLWLIDIKKILFLPPQHLDDNYYQWPHKPQIYYGLLYVFTAGL